MTTFSCRNAAVKAGSTTVVGMGTWSIEGVNVDQIDSTAFGSTWKTFEAGMQDGGNISFGGYADPGDTTGQNLIKTWNEDATHVSGDTGLRFYYTATSYYFPATTNPASFILITGYTIKADKNDILRIDFSAKVSGKLIST